MVSSHAELITYRGKQKHSHTLPTYKSPPPPHTNREPKYTHPSNEFPNIAYKYSAHTHTQPGGTWLTVVIVEMLGFLTGFAHDRALQETVDRVNLRMKKTQLTPSPHPALTEDRLTPLLTSVLLLSVRPHVTCLQWIKELIIDIWEIERGSKSGDLQKTIDFEVKEQWCRGQRVHTQMMVM